ncbi:MAG: hypothetical protein MJ252_06770 [archaeon]|nr:hypothetical protein [archaeon]
MDSKAAIHNPDYAFITIDHNIKYGSYNLPEFESFLIVPSTEDTLKETLKELEESLIRFIEEFFILIKENNHNFNTNAFNHGKKSFKYLLIGTEFLKLIYMIHQKMFTEDKIPEEFKTDN